METYHTAAVTELSRGRIQNNEDNVSDADNEPVLLPVPSCSNGRAVRVHSIRQEDDSGVNHLWKGEMWPARVGLIHARHVQNTRGAGANN